MRTLLALLMFTACAAQADDVESRLDELEQDVAFNEMMMLTAPRPQITNARYSEDAVITEPCEPHYIEVTDHGRIVRKCGIDPVYLKEATSKAMGAESSENTDARLVVSDE